VCWICAGADSYDAADRGNVSVVPAGAEGQPYDLSTSVAFVVVLGVNGRILFPCGSGALLPITGRKYQLFIVACNLHNICVASKDQGAGDKEL